jgi:diguanylate cyclase (GGDEF)-like protein/PAS domain S-box-containing protein
VTGTSDRPADERESIPTSLLLDTLPSGVTTYEADGRCRSANDAAAKLIGLPHEALLRQNFRELSSWRDSGLTAHACEALRSGVTFEGEIPITTSGGRELSLNFRLQRITVFDRPLLLAVFDDVTDRRKAEDALRLIQLSVDRSADLIHWIAPDGRLLYVSDSNCERHGYSREEMLTMTVFDLDPTQTPESWPALWERVKASGSLRFETVHKSRSGEIFPVEVTASNVTHKGREYNFSFARDISARKALEASLRLTQYSMDKAADYIFWIGPEGQFVNVGASACRRLGYSREEILGLTIFDIDPVAPRPWSRHWEQLKQQTTLTFESQHRTRSGELFPVEVTASYVEFGGRGYDFGFARDITARKAAEEELRQAREASDAAHRELLHQVRTDALTGVLNRRAVLEHLHAEVVRSERERAPLAIGMIDVDHFKQVNDEHGHAAGDQVLCEVVRRALSALRPYDAFGRMGGEEFLVVLPGVADTHVRDALERIRAAVATAPIALEDRRLNVTVSIGGTSSDGSVDGSLRAADDALYRAKAAGRDAVIVSSKRP